MPGTAPPSGAASIRPGWNWDSRRRDVPQPFGTRWLLPRLPDFARKHPDVTLNLSSQSRPLRFDETGFDGIARGALGAAEDCWFRTRQYDIARTARDMLGGNGISDEFGAPRFFPCYIDLRILPVN
jgi:hypothetical protein